MKWAKFFGLFWGVFFTIFFMSCEKDSDGPMDVVLDDFDFYGQGFFLQASLDSGKKIHLLEDTLFLQMGQMWTFSNCALESIDLHYQKEDSILWISPKLKIHADAKDCAAPYYRPDTVLKILLKNLADGVGMIKVKNHRDSLLDSILLRRGHFTKDTFFIYMDSSFSNYKNLPLRTKGENKGILRILDSITPRTFYYRTIKSTCTHRVDMCNEILPDTLYPTSWNFGDTNLVPVHYVCADSDSVYCINTKWENDSTKLGEIKERPDTIWHYSTYFIEKIPDCSTYNSLNVYSYGLGNRVRFIRELLTVNKEEKYCGPASKMDLMVYRLPGIELVSDDSDFIDSLYTIWKNAKIAPDTLVLDSTKNR